GFALEGQKRKKEMKKFNVGLALIAVAVCALMSFSPLNAYADSVTLTLASAPTSYGGEDVYPYNFNVNGSATTIPLMCLSLNNKIDFGESWTASISAISSFTGTTLTDYEEAAWLFNDANVNPTNVGDDQWAAWEIFATVTNPPDSGVATQYNAAVAAVTTGGGLPASWRWLACKLLSAIRNLLSHKRLALGRRHASDFHWRKFLLGRCAYP
ncbi:MAG: hypothetical protein ABR990_07725, partial [Terracidiphilus sp.]